MRRIDEIYTKLQEWVLENKEIYDCKDTFSYACLTTVDRHDNTLILSISGGDGEEEVIPLPDGSGILRIWWPESGVTDCGARDFLNSLFSQ